MRKLVFSVLLVIVLIGVSLIAGYWPEHQRLTALDRQVSELRQQLERSQANVRVCKLENQLLAVIEQTGAKNFGTAQDLSNKFFDSVGNELMQADDADTKNLLQQVLSTRDLVTAGLARGEADTLQNLEVSQSRFRQFFQRSDSLEKQ
jgi:hypothetical protein